MTDIICDVNNNNGITCYSYCSVCKKFVERKWCGNHQHDKWICPHCRTSYCGDWDDTKEEEHA